MRVYLRGNECLIAGWAITFAVFMVFLVRVNKNPTDYTFTFSDKSADAPSTLCSAAPDSASPCRLFPDRPSDSRFDRGLTTDTEVLRRGAALQEAVPEGPLLLVLVSGRDVPGAKNWICHAKKSRTDYLSKTLFVGFDAPTVDRLNAFASGSGTAITAALDSSRPINILHNLLNYGLPVLLADPWSLWLLDPRPAMRYLPGDAVGAAADLQPVPQLAEALCLFRPTVATREALAKLNDKDTNLNNPLGGPAALTAALEAVGAKVTLLPPALFAPPGVWYAEPHFRNAEAASHVLLAT
eukprot:Selendium_serpulae@DN4048_c0_g1_i4.p2